MKKILLAIAVITLLIGGFVFSRSFTLFVVQPLGAIPDGVTLLIPRTEKLNFIDSADAICERYMGGVNLICRGTVLGTISKAEIYGRFPYSEFLYLRSTDGAVYSK